MKKQITLSEFTDEPAQAAKKKEFLAQIERIIPRSDWIGMIQPNYFMSGLSAEMLRCHVPVRCSNERKAAWKNRR